MSLMMRKLLTRLYAEETGDPNAGAMSTPAPVAEEADPPAPEAEDVNEFSSLAEEDLGGDDIDLDTDNDVVYGEKESEQPAPAEPAQSPEASTADQSKVEAQKPEGEKEPPTEKPVEAAQKPEAKGEEVPAPEPFDVEKWREGEHKRLQETYFVTDEDAQELLLEPQKVLPKLAANMHMQVMQEVHQMMQQVLPRQIQAVQSSISAETEAKNAMFSRWPGLKEHEAQVLQIGKMFRALNPNASKEEALERIGAMTYQALGMEIPPAPNAAPPAPAPARPAPFRPAGTTSQSVPAQPAQAHENLFVEFAEEDLRYDRGE